MDLTEAAVTGRELLSECGLTDWEFGFDRARKRAGQCNFTARRITVSRALTQLYSREQFRYIVLHEVAHALAGANAGHGPRWQAYAQQLGTGTKAHVPQEFPHLELPWQGTCAAGHTVYLTRAPRRVSSCRRCAKHFTAEHILIWARAGQPVQLQAMPKSYQREWRSLGFTAGNHHPAAHLRHTPAQYFDQHKPTSAHLRNATRAQ